MSEFSAYPPPTLTYPLYPFPSAVSHSPLFILRQLLAANDGAAREEETEGTARLHYRDR